MQADVRALHYEHARVLMLLAPGRAAGSRLELGEADAQGPYPKWSSELDVDTTLRYTKTNPSPYYHRSLNDVHSTSMRTL